LRSLLVGRVKEVDPFKLFYYAKYDIKWPFLTFLYQNIYNLGIIYPTNLSGCRSYGNSFVIPLLKLLSFFNKLQFISIKKLLIGVTLLALQFLSKISRLNHVQSLYIHVANNLWLAFYQDQVQVTLTLVSFSP